MVGISGFCLLIRALIYVKSSPKSRACMSSSLSSTKEKASSFKEGISPICMSLSTKLGVPMITLEEGPALSSVNYTLRLVLVSLKSPKHKFTTSIIPEQY